MWVSTVTGKIYKVHKSNLFQIEIIAAYNPNVNNARDFLDFMEALSKMVVLRDFNIDALKDSILLERELGETPSSSYTLIEHIFINNDEAKLKIANIGYSFTDHKRLIFYLDRGDLFKD
ncbi:hypothetical protein PR048_020881 [Dryococelus australis]|uniref:Uncharacterized protein n=1 Tax=Dryococelus australis TaxID=614101 RepID=A0ABQ9GWN2_9NEOP|nr:hypothetical protein PR048_020881 [Dryococelus australis]